MLLTVYGTEWPINQLYSWKNIDSNSTKKLKVKQEKQKNTQKISTFEHDTAECNRKSTLIVYWLTTLHNKLSSELHFTENLCWRFSTDSVDPDVIVNNFAE